MMRYALHKRHLPVKTYVLLCAILLLGIYGFFIVDQHLKPTLLTIAEARARVMATEAINNVIFNEVTKDIDYQKLVSVRVDERGRVVLMQPNTVEFNRLAAHTTIKVQNALQQIGEEKISIPMGQILGSQLLASLGPRITVTIIPIGTVQVKVVDKFEQAGINQTKHMIYLTANTQVRIVVPLVSQAVEVSTRVPISEYVVVGEVPSTYVQIPYPIEKELLKDSDNNGQS